MVYTASQRLKKVPRFFLSFKLNAMEQSEARLSLMKEKRGTEKEEREKD